MSNVRYLNQALLVVLCSGLTLLAGCSDYARYVIRANADQVDNGARIEMSGKTGRLRIPAAAQWKQGLDVAITETAHASSSGANILDLVTENQLQLTFAIGAGQYICTTCPEHGLPKYWHRETVGK
ncbi:hypothetical protein GTP56_06020 [Duganella sp. FT134W]|uniref:Lipoprotein n=1 Tax=Duganella margarita TaxID=2692170 RepID=A0A7X4KFQ4_9BURK|nr:hypothetical protein [Duganella margarita]MYM71754.1 hypothetical protein [Duganella margarita]